MPLPRALKKQAEDATALHQRAYQPAEDRQDDPQEGQQDDPQEGQQDDPQEGQQDDPQEGQQDPAAHEDASWEHRYRTLQGKYNAEIGGLREQNNELAQELRALRQQVSQMQQSPKTTPPPEENADLDLKGLVTEDEIEEYGPDTVRFVETVVSRALERADKVFGARLEKVAGEVQSTRKQSARERALSYLDAKMPTWREVNKDASFLSWLDKPDPMSGQRRHDLLLQHFEAGNGEKCKLVFDTFLAEQPAAKPARKKADMAERAAPRSSLPQNPRPAPRSRVYSGADIEAKYSSFTRRRNKAKTQADIDQIAKEQAAFEAELGAQLNAGVGR